jgi:hypothetical protein
VGVVRVKHTALKIFAERGPSTTNYRARLLTLLSSITIYRRSTTKQRLLAYSNAQYENSIRKETSQPQIIIVQPTVTQILPSECKHQCIIENTKASNILLTVRDNHEDQCT